MGDNSANETNGQFGALRIADILFDAGFMIMLTWHYLVLFSSVFGDLRSQSDLEYIYMRQLTLYLSLAFSFGAVWLFGKFRDRSARSSLASPRVVLAVGLFACAASCLYALAASSDVVSIQFELLCMVLLGVSEGLLMCLWLLCFIERRGELFTNSFAVDMTGGGVLAFLICCFQWPIGSVAAAGAPLFSSLILMYEKARTWNSRSESQASRRCEEAASGEGDLEEDAMPEGVEPVAGDASKPRRPKISRSSWIMTVFVAIYAIVFGSMQGSYVVADESVLMAADDAIVLLGVTLAGVAIACLPRDLDSLQRIDSIHRISLILFVLGSVIASMSEGSSVFFIVAQIVILAGFNLFDFGVLVYEITSRRTESGETSRVVSHTRPVVYLGLSTGLLIGHAVALAEPFHDLSATITLMSGVSIVSLVTTVLFPLNGFRAGASSEDEGPIHPLPPMLSVVAATAVPELPDDWESPWRHACNDIARQYQLSPREKEIFFLVAKGRNADYIQQELIISTHTVKTHIANIYRKLNVHSSQELLDLVEKVRGA